MKEKKSLMLGLIPSIRRAVRYVPDVVYTDEDRMTMENLARHFSAKEIARMAYAPLILADAAFRFSISLCDYCASSRLPYKKETRAIRSAYKEYQSANLAMLGTDITRRLNACFDEFFDHSSPNTTTLWYVINSQLKKYYPELDEEYEVLSMAFAPLCLFACVRQFERQSDAIVTSRLCLSQPQNTANHLFDFVAEQLFSIIGNYHLHETNMVWMSVKIISRRVFEIIDEFTGLSSDSGQQ